MNTELIKLIDEFGEQMGKDTGNWLLLADCKAEIERLESELAKAKEYVLLSDDEFEAFLRSQVHQPMFESVLKKAELFFVKRAGLVVKGKE